MYRVRINKKNISPQAKKKAKFSEMSEEIIRISDIVLEVLDARFIKETRNHESEKLIEKYGKKLIFVINKSDLADIEKLKKELPEDMRPYVLVSCIRKRGVQKLRDKIKMEVKRIGDEKYPKKHVGIIGYPNTGKSSLINMLIGKSSVGTSSEAGFTKGVQKIRLAENILLIDTPGVIPQKEYVHERIMETGKHSIIGARTNSQIKDPESEIYSIMNKYPGVIEKFYGFENLGFEVFIEQLGRKRNFIKKGNLVDEERTLRSILKDWQEGKIRIR